MSATTTTPRNSPPANEVQLSGDMRMLLSGNHAVSYGAMRARPQLVPDLSHHAADADC